MLRRSAGLIVLTVGCSSANSVTEVPKSDITLEAPLAPSALAPARCDRIRRRLLRRRSAGHQGRDLAGRRVRSTRRGAGAVAARIDLVPRGSSDAAACIRRTLRAATFPDAGHDYALSVVIAAEQPSSALPAATGDTQEYGMVGLLNSGDTSSATGNMWGSEIGDAYGEGGLGMTGVGEGGGRARRGASASVRSARRAQVRALASAAAVGSVALTERSPLRSRWATRS